MALALIMAIMGAVAGALIVCEESGAPVPPQRVWTAGAVGGVLGGAMGLAIDCIARSAL